MSRPGPANRRTVHVYDLRSEESQPPPKHMDVTGTDIDGFLTVLHQEFGFRLREDFSLVTTDRILLDSEKFNQLKDGSTLYLLRHKDQNLPASTEESITYTPHFHTLTEAGTYEYHASEGNNALPSALAELIDNSLSATAKNDGMRNIEIRMMFNEMDGKPAVVVLDNGCGMTSNKLKNWAVYKLSKFIREDSMFASQQEQYRRPDPVQRSLNSDLSYFGVGGKQAIFYIGNSVRMITKEAGSPDVHELNMSEEDFEMKEMQKRDVFSGRIKNRKPGDSSHVTTRDEYFLHKLIAEERGKESFTAVVITGLKPANIAFMKEECEVMTRQLAHIFHYYIHGVDGNCQSGTSAQPRELSRIQIEISRSERQGLPHVTNLRTVRDDMQSLYIDKAADTFEFTATVPGGGRVEGLIRYHPFLYDNETYPQGPTAEETSTLEDNPIENEPVVLNSARGKKPIFECFWNGRLIPSTTISEFSWCSWCSCSSRASKELEMCYDRLSGVLFTDDHFKVTQNKLTFMDLELRLKDKATFFTPVVNGQERRGNIEREFTAWLQKCHATFDKQVKFMGYKGPDKLFDASKRKLFPCAVFSSIDWGGKTFKEGQLVKSQRTKPILHGKVIRFLLHGDYEGDVFATGGVVEIDREPQGLYNTKKIFSILQINKNATLEEIQKNISSDSDKLPVELQVEWPRGNALSENAVCSAGSPIGPIQVKIQNRLGCALSNLPGGHGSPRLSVVLKIVLHGSKADKVTVTFNAKQPVNHAFCFKEYGKLTEPGRYSFLLNAVVNEEETSFGGRALPSYNIRFTVESAEATQFVVGKVGPDLRVGVPFDIPLFLQDAYGNPAKPSGQLKPSLSCSDLDLSYNAVQSKGKTLTITGVRAKGKIQNNNKQMGYMLTVTLPGLEKDTQTIKIILLPGLAHYLHVTPEEIPLTVENGNLIMFDVEIHDVGGNITANPRQTVQCKIPGLQTVSADCSRTGTGKIVTRKISQKIINGEPQILKVQFEMKDQSQVSPLTRELKVMPSERISTMELLSGDNDNLVLRNNDKIEWPAGGCVENLQYKLKDEAGKEVALSPEIASKIKVSWAEDAELDDLVLGKLPDIQVTTRVSKPQSYLVSHLGSDVSVSFSITPNPGEPTQLKATVAQSTVKLGETMEGSINLELLDNYNNPTKMLTPSRENLITVEAEGLDKSALTFDWQRGGSVAVAGVRFQAGVPGTRNILFRYGECEERVMMQVTAGVPAKMQLVSAPPKPLQFLNNKGNSTPFVLRLCDEWGNPSPEERLVFDFKSAPPELQVKSSVSSQPAGADGQVSVTLTSVSGPKGYYSLTFLGSFNNKAIPGPVVNLTVIPDPNKPVKLSVQGDVTAGCPAGGVFPVFSVTVVSDEGRPIGNIDLAALSMLLWKEDTPTEEPIEFRCSKPLENDCEDSFYFRNKEVPAIVGRYIIQFSLRSNETAEVLQSDQIPINVVANKPEKLKPDSQIPNPVVSLSENVAHRTLLENLTLRITDCYGNPAGENLDGRVIVTVTHPDGETNKPLPLFEGGEKQVQFYLVEGKTHISRLAVMENSPYEDGAKYILVFKPEVLMETMSLTPFQLPFHFYSENQQTLFELNRRKAELTQAVDQYQVMFTQANGLLQLLEKQSQTCSQKEAEQRRELGRRRVTVAQPVSLPAIDKLIRKKEVEAENIQRSRRSCSVLDPFKGQQDVLGKVCHLALVQEDDAARVLSWHMRGFMKCVVTKTTEAAQEINRDTDGNQQVMALDSVYVHPRNRSLPHLQNGRPPFDPPGNPVFARELLIHPQHEEHCEVVFKNLLGETIVIDDLESANQYRRAVVQRRMPCPNILTRSGEKVSAMGIFGGSQNKAPPIERLEVVFGAPLPAQYNTLKEEKDLLVQYRLAVLKKEEADKELNDHKKSLNSAEYQGKKLKMEDKQKQLQEIDKQLESMQARLGRRRLQEAADSCDITAKRPRM